MKKSVLAKRIEYLETIVKTLEFTVKTQGRIIEHLKLKAEITEQKINQMDLNEIETVKPLDGG